VYFYFLCYNGEVMDTVELDGVEYVKASVAAKRFQYTADYIGQLCRGRKIDARLVGRTWFVNPISLEEHKQQRYQKTELAKTTSVSASDTASNKKVERVPVPPPAKVKTPRAIYNSTAPSRRTEERTLRVSYELDDGHLIPNLIKREYAPPRSLRVSPADATKIKIQGARTQSSFIPEEIPDVALSGKITVNPIEDETNSDILEAEEAVNETPEKTLKIKDISDEKENKSAPANTPRNNRTVKIRKHKKQHPVSTTSVVSSGVFSESAPVQKLSNNAVSSAEMPSFLPASVRPRPKQRAVTFVTMSPLLATLISVLFVFLIFSASTTVVFNDFGYQSQIVLQVANLLDIIAR
jgi:hypothetical protein